MNSLNNSGMANTAPMPAEKTLFNQIEVYEVEDIARLAGVSSGTIRKCIREGRLRAQRIGRKWKVTRENALAFLNGSHDEERSKPHFPQGSAPRSPSTGLSDGFEAGTEVTPDTDQPGANSRPTSKDPVRIEAEPERPFTIEEIADFPVSSASLARSQPQAMETTLPAGSSASSAQLLFLKPEDLDRLVSALAIHVDRIEQTAERRETQLQELVQGLAQENQTLREELHQMRDEQRESIQEAAQSILNEVNSSERRDTERFRFRWLQDQLNLVMKAVDASPDSRPRSGRRRGWWPFRR